MAAAFHEHSFEPPPQKKPHAHYPKEQGAQCSFQRKAAKRVTRDEVSFTRSQLRGRGMIRLIQLQHPAQGRRIAMVEGERLQLVRDLDSIHRAAHRALEGGIKLEEFVASALAVEHLEYPEVYWGKSLWKILPAFDHPDEPARCIVTGTGLTHRKSADNRQAMHAGEKQAAPTDSMRMYQWGVEGGRPAQGRIGVAPEWFYKGCGTILRAHGEPLDVPAFGLDGGEEAEVAGAYIISETGVPCRVGFVQANEFSDHQIEAKNYLYLAHSKLRSCSVGPELIVGGDFNGAEGTVTILRGAKAIWRKTFATGEQNMSHSLANLEHHHFKYSAHRRPGDAHLHFFGADVFSFGEGIQLEDGDTMKISLAGFGMPLMNPIRMDQGAPKLVKVQPL